MVRQFFGLVKILHFSNCDFPISSLILFFFFPNTNKYEEKAHFTKNQIRIFSYLTQNKSNFFLKNFYSK